MGFARAPRPLGLGADPKPTRASEQCGRAGKKLISRRRASETEVNYVAAEWANCCARARHVSALLGLGRGAKAQTKR